MSPFDGPGKYAPTTHNSACAASEQVPPRRVAPGGIRRLTSKERMRLRDRAFRIMWNATHVLKPTRYERAKEALKACGVPREDYNCTPRELLWNDIDHDADGWGEVAEEWRPRAMRIAQGYARRSKLRNAGLVEAQRDAERGAHEADLDAATAKMRRHHEDPEIAEEYEAEYVRLRTVSKELNLVSNLISEKLLGEDWHAARAVGLGRDLAERVGRCGKTTARVACECGPRSTPIHCNHRIACRKCRSSHLQKHRKRWLRAMGSHQRAARNKWLADGRPRYKEPKWALMTLTGPHQKEATETRKMILSAWTRMRAHLHRFCGYAPKFAMAWEVTEGSDGLAHVHAHLVILLPFIDVEKLGEWWSASMGQYARLNLDGITSTKKALNYVMTYATKGSEPSELPTELAAQWLEAMYRQRLVSTSRRFAVLDDEGGKCCDQCGETVKAIEIRELCERAGSAWWYEATGVDPPFVE